MVAVEPLLLADSLPGDCGLIGIRGGIRGQRLELRHQVDAVPESLCDPGEVVHAGQVDLDLTAVRAGHAIPLCDVVGDEVLQMENLMAATKSLDLRPAAEESGGTQRHRVRVVDDPGLRAVFLDGLGELDEQGDGSAGTHDAAGSGRIADRLQNSVLFGQDEIAPAAFRPAWFDGDDDQVASVQSLAQLLFGEDFYFSFKVVDMKALLGDLYIVQSRLIIDIVQHQGTGHVRAHGQVTHELNSPETAAATDDADSRIFHSSSSNGRFCRLRQSITTLHLLH